MKFESVCVVGAGRVGKTIAARLAERVATRTTGRELETGTADLVLLCVPDRAIADVAGAIARGPWIAHTSGASPLSVLDPHERRFSLHPLQTLHGEDGPGQLDGAWAAVTADDADGLAAAGELARLLGVRSFEVDDARRPLYHAAAAFTSAFLVTLHDVAGELITAAGAPPEALEPLMQRTIEHGFHHTGPLVRGDWETVDRHVEAISAYRPDLVPLYKALAEAEAALLAAGAR